MDRYARTADIVKSYYRFKNSGNAVPFIKEVCDYFDFVKSMPLSESDMTFLLFLANEAGVPQYFDLLHKKYNHQQISSNNTNLITISALFHDASLIRGSNKLHRYQQNVLNYFIANRCNRYVLTAPTSFGKTFIVYEIIQRMQYRNILLIFPSISLLSENFSRLNMDYEFSEYQIHSLSEEEYDTQAKNILFSLLNDFYHL